MTSTRLPEPVTADFVEDPTDSILAAHQDRVLREGRETVEALLASVSGVSDRKRLVRVLAALAKIADETVQQAERVERLQDDVLGGAGEGWADGPRAVMRGRNAPTPGGVVADSTRAMDLATRLAVVQACTQADVPLRDGTRAWLESAQRDVFGGDPTSEASRPGEDPVSETPTSDSTWEPFW